MTTRLYLMLSSLIFALVALAHLVRLAEGWPAVLGTTGVPMWASGLALIFCGVAAVWGFVLVGRFRHSHH